jgi:hypothetical protein
MTSRVNCYAGSSYPEHPRSFTWEGRLYEVKEMIHRRREPHGVDFIVRCVQDEALFELFYTFEDQTWHIMPKGYIILEKEKRG